MPTPLTLLTGFLGAGKTTLLRRLLSDPRGVRYGVLVNDFGAINIDAGLVVETKADSIALSNGCVCCSLKDDLVAAVGDILARTPRPDHILLEASGVSRPLAILSALDAPELREKVAVEATLCLVDAAEFGGLDFAMTELAIDQACSSDILIINKCDVASEKQVAEVEGTLSGPLPEIRMVRAVEADVPRGLVVGFDSEAAKARESTLPLSYSGRRGRLFGRSDPNVELVLYAEAWARKIQLNMTFDMVRELLARSHVNPMITVAMRSDGTVESVQIVTSSGVPELDEAIRRVIESQAPYPAFSPALAREFDVVEIRRTWYFDSAIRLY